MTVSHDVEHGEDYQMTISGFKTEIQRLDQGVFHLLSMGIEGTSRGPGRTAGVEDH